jgi:hypothetical protein
MVVSAAGANATRCLHVWSYPKLSKANNGLSAECLSSGWCARGLAAAFSVVVRLYLGNDLTRRPDRGGAFETMPVRNSLPWLR